MTALNPTMLHVFYFGALADELNCREEQVQVPADINTTGRLRDWLANRGTPWQALQQTRIKVAVNHEIARSCHLLRNGDEVAFFPPVTGG